MWSGQNKVWFHYVKDIIAADVVSAVFLSAYVRNMAISKSYIPAMEVIDLQKYKIIRQHKKVRQAIKDRLHMPFVFLSCMN